MEQLLKTLGTFLTNMMKSVKKYGVKTLLVVVLSVCFMTVIMKVTLSNDIPKLIEKQEQADTQNATKLRKVQFQKEQAIQQLLDRATFVDSLCDHDAVSMFHDNIMTDDGLFDWQYMSVKLHSSVNDNYSIDIIGSPETSLFPHYVYLRKHGSFEGTMDQMAKIDRRLATMERRGGVKYLKLVMVFKDGKPYGVISFAWESIPKQVSPDLDEIVTEIENIIKTNSYHMAE